MTYAYDDYVQMPTKDLYDTAVMKMAIEAAKDMYDKGQTQMENFYKTYGDFMSPFAKDMEWYGGEMKRIRDVVNDAYSKGIDLFKSPEGRMLVSQLSHSIDPLRYNTARQNAKIGYEYLEAAQKLASQGKYSEAQELFDILQSGGTPFGEFSTIDPNTGKIRMWGRTSPVQAMSLRDFTSPFYSTRTARDLTKEDVESVPGYVYDPKYNYSGYLKQDALAAAPGIVNALEADPRFAYFKEQAKQQARLLNPTASEEDIEKKAAAQLYENVAESGRTYFIEPTKKENQFALDDYRTANDDRLDASKKYREWQYKMLEKYDKNMDGVVTEEERNDVDETDKKNKGKEKRNHLLEQFDKGQNQFIYGNSELSSDDTDKLKDNADKVISASLRNTEKLREFKNAPKDQLDSNPEKNKGWYKAVDDYLKGKVVAKGLFDLQTLSENIGRVVDKSKSATVFSNPGDVDRLVSKYEMVSKTVGGGPNNGKNFINTDRSELNKIKSDKLKIQFTNETYTAPIRSDDGKRVKMVQYQKVKLYKQVSNKSDEEIDGEYWFQIQQGKEYTGKEYTDKKTGKKKIVYQRGPDTTWDSEHSGEYTSTGSRIEKSLGSSQTAFDNSQTRPF